jgi:hypothetical protein
MISGQKSVTMVSHSVILSEAKNLFKQLSRQSRDSPILIFIF